MLLLLSSSISKYYYRLPSLSPTSMFVPILSTLFITAVARFHRFPRRPRLRLPFGPYWRYASRFVRHQSHLDVSSNFYCTSQCLKHTSTQMLNRMSNTEVTQMRTHVFVMNVFPLSKIPNNTQVIVTLIFLSKYLNCRFTYVSW